MKKNILLFFPVTLLLSLNVFAGSTDAETAKTVALNFFKLNAHIDNSKAPALKATLTFTKTEEDNTADFYVFDISPAKGFVIVTADDNLEPVIGYSLESNFESNTDKFGLKDWMNTASVKINYALRQNVLADEHIKNLWTSYAQGVNPGISKCTTVGPLLTTTWNQEPYYNQYCPYNTTDQQLCVTGCVATAMAQIMKYWSYPAQGSGSYSYNDAPPSYSNNYGTQSANFGTTTYQWTQMPNSISSNNTQIATLMYQCGVSVGMDYGDDKQGGSGAWVLSSEAGTGRPSAQQAYTKYFGYNSSTMQGVHASSYSSQAWTALIQNELSAGRVVQYQGTDPNAGGHTWVCDGFDANGMFHMNWGWGGYDNGYFSLSNLSVAGYVFSSDDAALIGIQPNVTTSPCSVPTNLTTTNITSNSATLNWGGVTGAVSYGIQYRTSGSSTWLTGTSTTGSLSISGLSADSTYQWQVKTVCSSGSSAYSSAVFFITNVSTPCSVPSGLTVSNIINTGATLSWSPVQGALAYNLQWKYAASNSWNTVSNITGSFYSLSGIPSCNSYQFKVQTVCSSGTSAYSTAISFTTTGCVQSYCASTSANCNYEYIKNVRFGSINNTTGATGYTNYTNLSTNVTGGSTNTITLTPGFSGTSYVEYWTVYIDYNHDGQFAAIGETVLKVSSKSAISKSFTIPISALNGTTRMRIQMQYGGYENNPCGTVSYGSVQDYTINITGNAKLSISETEDNAENLGDMKLYPNPAQNNVTIQFSSSNDGAARINIYNLAGQRMVSEEKPSAPGLNILNINTAILTNGIYICDIENNGEVKRQKFIIAK